MHNFLSHCLLGLCCQALGYGYDPPRQNRQILGGVSVTQRISIHHYVPISWPLAVTFATPSPWAYASPLVLSLASLALHLSRGAKQTVYEGCD